MPLFLPSAGMICAEKTLILDGNALIWLCISSVKYIRAGRKWGGTIGKCGCEGRPLKGKINGGNAGDFDGGVVCEGRP